MELRRAFLAFDLCLGNTDLSMWHHVMWWYVVCTFLPLRVFFALGRTACRIARLCMKSEWLTLQAEIPSNVVFFGGWIELKSEYPRGSNFVFRCFLFLFFLKLNMVASREGCQGCLSTLSQAVVQTSEFSWWAESSRCLASTRPRTQVASCKSRGWKKKSTWKLNENMPKTIENMSTTFYTILMYYSRDISQRLRSPYELLILRWLSRRIFWRRRLHNLFAKVSSCTNWRSRAVAFVSSLSESIAMAIEALRL